MNDDLSGTGIIYIEDLPVCEAFSWLSIEDEPGDMIAEGSISGAEDLLRSVHTAKAAKLQLQDGPLFSLEIFGGATGTRWVRLLKEPR